MGVELMNPWAFCVAVDTCAVKATQPEKKSEVTKSNPDPASPIVIEEESSDCIACKAGIETAALPAMMEYCKTVQNPGSRWMCEKFANETGVTITDAIVELMNPKEFCIAVDACTAVIAAISENKIEEE